MRNVTYNAAVENEVIGAAVYYEQECEGLGTSFLNDYEETVSKVLKRPLAWPIHEQPFRRHQLKHFPYAVIYRPLEGQVRILALMNLHRHPDYWKGRN